MPKVKAVAKRVGRAFVTALTAPEIVSLEKQLAIKIAIKVLLSAGAGAGLTELFTRVH